VSLARSTLHVRSEPLRVAAVRAKHAQLRESETAFWASTFAAARGRGRAHAFEQLQRNAIGLEGVWLRAALAALEVFR
jgi:hypothetical protein